MNKEKEIEDKIENTVFYAKNEAEKQADKFGYTGDKREFHILSTFAIVLVVAGYCKADEVRKETLREIDELAAKCGLDEFRSVELRKYAKQLGVEVDGNGKE